MAMLHILVIFYVLLIARSDAWYLKETNLTVVGSAARSDVIKNASKTQYRQILSNQFGQLTPEYELQWAALVSAHGQTNFSQVDVVVDFAVQHSMDVYGHALVWYMSMPGWLNSLSKDQLNGELQAHIASVVGRYKGVINAWTVVNEAIADDASGFRKCLLYDVLGSNYISTAFHAAHTANPNATLFYNDGNFEGYNGKTIAIHDMLKKSIAAGVPIHGIGFQSHYLGWDYPGRANITKTMDLFAGLGLRIRLTEIDVQTRDIPGSRADKLQREADIFADIVVTCVEHHACEGITFWGFTDAYTWIPSLTGVTTDEPLLYDATYVPKPGYYSVLYALVSRGALLHGFSSVCNLVTPTGIGIGVGIGLGVGLGVTFLQLVVNRRSNN